MYLSKNSIEFTDLLILRGIMDYIHANEGKPPSASQLVTLVNQKIREEAIGFDRTAPISGRGILSYRIKKMRQAGLLIPSGSHLRMPYKPEAAGIVLMDRLGADWRRWPLSVPIANGGIQLDQAKYK